jgi:hypothetical protein
MKAPTRLALTFLILAIAAAIWFVSGENRAGNNLKPRKVRRHLRRIRSQLVRRGDPIVSLPND